ncbi:MAG: hypothetical protein GY799_29910 [Desulfobulbaceae bacterium]|nr:hypothetical protein [Desulfobulbaceae bacterium]
MKKFIIAIALIGMISGCDSSKGKLAMSMVKSSCKTGSTITFTVTTGGLFNEVSTSCSYIKD